MASRRRESRVERNGRSVLGRLLSRSEGRRNVGQELSIAWHLPRGISILPPVGKGNLQQRPTRPLPPLAASARNSPLTDVRDRGSLDSPASSGSRGIDRTIIGEFEEIGDRRMVDESGERERGGGDSQQVEKQRGGIEDSQQSNYYSNFLSPAFENNVIILISRLFEMEISWEVLGVLEPRFE